MVCVEYDQHYSVCSADVASLFVLIQLHCLARSMCTGLQGYEY